MTHGQYCYETDSREIRIQLLKTFSEVNIGVNHNFWEVLEIKYTVRFLTRLPAFFSKSFVAVNLFCLNSSNIQANKSN